MMADNANALGACGAVSDAPDSARAGPASKRDPPAFQCYAADWCAGEEYKLASAAERGLLFSLLNYCWVNWSISTDPKHYARLLDLMPDDAPSLDCGLIKKHFKPCRNDSSRLHCPELDRQRADLDDRRAKQSEGGRSGGKRTQERVRRKQEGSSPSSQPSSQPASQPSRQPSMQDQGPEKSREKQRGTEENRREKSPAFKQPDMNDPFVRGLCEGDDTFSQHHPHQYGDH